jgi:hypothetical protein
MLLHLSQFVSAPAGRHWMPGNAAPSTEKKSKAISSLVRRVAEIRRAKANGSMMIILSPRPHRRVIRTGETGFPGGLSVGLRSRAALGVGSYVADRSGSANSGFGVTTGLR